MNLSEFSRKPSEPDNVIPLAERAWDLGEKNPYEHVEPEDMDSKMKL